MLMMIILAFFLVLLYFREVRSYKRFLKEDKIKRIEKLYGKINYN